MAQTRFSQRLSHLMKERKISGQKIGAAIGKSQKTISRYANGEVDPSNEVKNLIYKVIADISGIEEDGTTEEILALSEHMRTSDWTEAELLLEEGPENEDVEADPIDRLFASFDKLSRGAQSYFNEHMRLFAQVTKEDMELMTMFRNLPPKKQNKFMKFLEGASMSFDMRGDAVKIGAFMQLVEISRDKPVLIYDRRESTSAWDEKTAEINGLFFNSCIKTEYGWNCKGSVPCTFDFLGYGPLDWYYLLRVAMYSAVDRDIDICSLNAGSAKIFAGSNLRTLLHAIENGYF